MSHNYDVMFLYNEREDNIIDIVDELESAGYATFYWQRDVKPAGPVEIEVPLFEETATVLILLGKLGWGPSHQRIAEEALKTGKKIVTALIGDPPEGSEKKLGDLFSSRRYVDLRLRNEGAYTLLFRMLGPPESYRNTSRFDPIISILTDGDNESRTRVLRLLKESEAINKEALSIRLRDEIQNRFQNLRDAKNYKSNRPAERVSTIRSWMLSALNEMDREEKNNRDLLLKHLNPEFEPFEDVRFWVLAGMYLKDASYVRDAAQVSTSDSSPLVNLLALTIRDTAGPDVIGRLKQYILSDDPDQQLYTLRVLRIIPVPELVPEICHLILDRPSDNLTYAAFYALVRREMARAASALLTEDAWHDFIGKMLNRCRLAETNAIAKFASILSFGDAGIVDSILGSYSSDRVLAGIVAIVSRHLADMRTGSHTKGLSISGYSPDSNDIAQDWLDIRQDKKTLTTIMLAKEVIPPLAIGLFGKWGSGKSFFMEALHQEVIDFQNDENLASHYCANVVQIRFNAWHYVDTSLWASLVDVIFEKLNDVVSPPDSIQDKEKALNDGIAGAIETLNRAVEEKSKTEALIREKQVLQKTMEENRINRPVAYSELKAEDIKDLLTAEQQRELKRALDEMGIPEALQSVADVEALFSEALTVKGKINAAFVAVLHSPNRRMIFVLLAVLLFIAPVAGWAVNSLFHWDKVLTTIAALSAQFTGFLTGIVVLLRKGLVKVKSSLDVVGGLKKRIEDKLSEKRKEKSKEEQELESELALLETNLSEAETSLKAASILQEDLKRQLEALDQQYSLNRFLADRYKSDDYRKHQGLISTIRRDFDALVSLLGKVPRGDKNFTPVDRIILYIDDLDRCPNLKIMEVLRAVHLMQAYPLFVVVVGVDPGWLLRSVNKSFAVFENDNTAKEDDKDWETTPQDFLEKIFQVPFCLRRMSENGFGNLIEHLFRIKQTPNQKRLVGQPEPGQSKIVREQKEGKSSDNGGQADERDNVHRQIGESGLPEGDDGWETEPEKAAPTTEFTITRDALQITPWEAEFAKLLFPFITTPRSTKRFTNIYRIVKVFAGKDELGVFEGSREVAGDFQIVMILLAVLIGGREDLPALFAEIFRYARQGRGLRDALQQIKNSRSKLSGFADRILLLKEMDHISRSAEPVLQWLPVVVRFSFDALKISELIQAVPEK